MSPEKGRAGLPVRESRLNPSPSTTSVRTSSARAYLHTTGQNGQRTSALERCAYALATVTLTFLGIAVALLSARPTTDWPHALLGALLAWCLFAAAIAFAVALIGPALRKAVRR